MKFCSECGNKFSKEDGKFCGECGASLNVKVSNSEKVLIDENNTEVKNLNNVEFFTPPMWRVILLSILSLGAYSIYWFARNYKAIKPLRKARGKNLSPVVAAIFNPVASVYIFLELKKILQSVGQKPKYNANLNAFFYFITTVFLSTAITFPFLAISVQPRILKLYELGYIKKPKKEFEWGELGMVLFGFIFFALGFIGVIFDDTHENDITYSVIQESQDNKGEFVFNDITYSVIQESQDDKRRFVFLDFNNPINFTDDLGNNFSVTTSNILNMGKRISNDFGYTAYSYVETAGIFIVVEFDVIFNGKTGSGFFKLMGGMITDQQERQYSANRIESCSPIKNYNAWDDKLVILKPGIPCKFRMLFEVAPDSESFYVNVEYSTDL